jgi:multicomponent Na+:H+ antiporter subunit D
VPSLLPLAALAIPLAAAVLIVFSRNRPNLREGWTLLAAISMFAAVAAMAPDVLDGREHETTLWTLAPGIAIQLRADALGMLFALSASALWILTSVFSIGYVRGLGEHKQTRYFASFAVCLAATMGIAFAADLFTFLVFYEILTIATYPLVVHKESPEAVAAARKYLGYLLTGGLILLLGVAFVLATAGSLDFVPGGFIAEHIGRAGVVLVFVTAFFGFGTKSAIMPLHAWLPSAMVAPTPVSALLHAVAVVKAGVFGFARAVGFVIGPQALQDAGVGGVLAGLALVTLVVASLVAIRQDGLKARLAYSTIAHLSYIVMGLAILSANAWTGSLFHIATHAVMKITLFFCAGALYVNAHLEKVSELDGIGRRMPLTMGAFTVASLGLIGIPPLAGFWSKWFLVLGSVGVGGYIYAAGLLLTGVLSVAYLMPIVHRAFLRPASGPMPDKEASPTMVVPLTVTAALVVVIGLSDVFGVFSLAEMVGALVTGGRP